MRSSVTAKFLLWLCQAFASAVFFIPCLVFSQNYGNFPTIGKENLLQDLELLYQALDKYHSGMYWYTPRDSVEMAFAEVRAQINRDMNVLEFHKSIGPLVSLTREDHTDIYLPNDVKTAINAEARFFPLTIAFLGEKLYCIKNGANEELSLEGKEIQTINGQTPGQIVEQLGTLFASDGYIKAVKYNDLEGLAFSRYYYYFFGNVDNFQVQIEGSAETITLKPLPIREIRANIELRYPQKEDAKNDDLLEFRLLNDSIAYLGIHTFSNSRISKNAVNDDFVKFLEASFKTIADKHIPTVVVDVSRNGGGTEGNEGILYSYFAENYQKYIKVRAKAQKVVLNNGVDTPIVWKTFGFFERVFGNKKMADGSYERKKHAGYGLMAYKKEPANKFGGKVYVIIGPVTYSGGSEFSNMMYTRKRATFVGQETGGGFYGNTSGYSRELTLPHSGITIDIPALQFMMNVEGLPFGRGVIPHHTIIPTIEEYLSGENPSLAYILKQEGAK